MTPVGRLCGRWWNGSQARADGIPAGSGVHMHHLGPRVVHGLWLWVSHGWEEGKAGGGEEESGPSCVVGGWLWGGHEEWVPGVGGDRMRAARVCQGAGQGGEAQLQNFRGFGHQSSLADPRWV